VLSDRLEDRNACPDDSSGHATLNLGPTKAKKITATAKKAGYTTASKKIRVK
jgi:hypothetical protein